MEHVSAADVIFTAAMIVSAVVGMVWMLRTIARFRVVLYVFMALLILQWLTDELAG